MSEYMQKLKERDPEAYGHVVKALGTPGSVPFRDMVKELSMCPTLNTEEEIERLKSALWLQRNRKRLL